MFPGFLTPVLTLISFQSHQILSSHASAEVRDENTPERNFALTRSRTHNHQVMSPTCSPLSHPGRAQSVRLSPVSIITSPILNYPALRIVLWQLLLLFQDIPPSFNPFPHNDTFWRPLGNLPFENNVGKGEIARNEQFLVFPQCFLPFA